MSRPTARYLKPAQWVSSAADRAKAEEEQAAKRAQEKEEKKRRAEERNREKHAAAAEKRKAAAAAVAVDSDDDGVEEGGSGGAAGGRRNGRPRQPSKRDAGFNYDKTDPIDGLDKSDDDEFQKAPSSKKRKRALKQRVSGLGLVKLVCNSSCVHGVELTFMHLESCTGRDRLWAVYMLCGHKCAIRGRMRGSMCLPEVGGAVQVFINPGYAHVGSVRRVPAFLVSAVATRADSGMIRIALHSKAFWTSGPMGESFGPLVE